MSLFEAHAVENEEFVLGPEQRAVGDAGGLEVSLGAPAERARIALVALHGRRLDHIAADVDGGVGKEGIEHRRAGVGQQDHVRLVDALPAADRRAVEHLAFDEEIRLLAHLRIFQLEGPWTPTDVVKLVQTRSVKFADLRSTDTRGKEQHVTIPGFRDGGFLRRRQRCSTASSISGWKGINESDMILLPDASTAVLDPFFADATVDIRPAM